ncbi:MAG: RNA polymerase sigma factor [Clostridiales bacterium]|nr:RNA polymerase sigma factor [Clostridiales bacterium]
MDSGASNYRCFLDGDDNSFAKIIDDCYDGLTLYLNTYVHNLTVAEELAEDTFVKLITKKPKFKGKSSFKTWLYAIGRNIVLDYMRHSSRHNTVPIDTLTEMVSDDKDIEQNYLREERKIIIHRAMQKLKIEYRQVLWLTYYENLSMKEIAQIMKKSVNSVEHLVSRARLALKSKLEKEDFIL